jgi:hypothetical protein
MKQNPHKKRDLLFNAQKLVVEFADLFHFAFPLLVIIQPALYHLALLRTDTELPIAASWIGDGQYPDLMPGSGIASGASLSMEDGPA